MNDQLKTGTTTIGVVFKDGILMAADKRVTMGNFIADPNFRKVFILNERLALTVAGVVSDAQLFLKLIKAEIKLKELRTGRDITVKEAANLLSGMLYGSMRQYIPSIAHLVLGGRDQDGYMIYDVSPDGALIERPGYTSSGSGSLFTLPILDSDYKKEMSKEQAIELVTKAINAALQRDSASGNGMDLVVIDRSGSKYALSREVSAKLA